MNLAGASREPRRFSSPLARALARTHGLDLEGLTGTGPNGRIVRADVLAHRSRTAPAPAPALPDEDIAFDATPTPIGRRLIARRLTESMQQAPHFHVRIDVAVDALLRLRAQWPDAGGPRPTLNDFVIQAAARALRAVPQVNASYGDTVIRNFRAVNIGVAVAVDQGLRTPVIRDADTKPLAVIAGEMRSLAQQAREGRLPADASRGATFSVSNLGGLGVTEFTAVINPPQGAILAVGAAQPRPVVQDGRIVIATMMTVVLSCDHRLIDGALAAHWLQALRGHLEAPDPAERSVP